MEEFLHKIGHDYTNKVDTEIFALESEVKRTVLNMAREWDTNLIVAELMAEKD